MSDWKTQPATVQAAVGAKTKSAVEAVKPPQPPAELVEKTKRVEIRYRSHEGMQTAVVTIRALNRGARLEASAAAARLAAMSNTSLAELDLETQADCLNFGIAWHGIVELADSNGRPDGPYRWIMEALDHDVAFAAVLAQEVQRHTNRYWFRASGADSQTTERPIVEVVPIGASGSAR